ncbi:MAG: hypothetical protein MUD16_03200 [Desulfobacterales bacterium]|jgi:hypothetical protein|nr:hypothetical protein [Desulfobacterales bacterium]
MATGKSKSNSVTGFSADQPLAEAMARMERLIHAGLCSNCRHAGDCAALMRAAVPIAQCEMHECGLSARPRLSLVKQRAAAEPEACDQEPLLGLCENCDHVRACRLPKPLSGVWQCEEYA